MKVRTLDDPRWKSALELLLSGSGSIDIGDLMRIGWWRGGVPADPNVRVDIFSDSDPRFLTKAKALRLIDEGLDLIQALRTAHPELDALMAREPVKTELVYDYGKGSVRIATVATDRSITWEETLVGREHGSRVEDE